MNIKSRSTLSAFVTKVLASSIASAVLLASVSHAAGLGKLTVLSSLGQPLNAEIELTTVTSDDSGLVAKLASSDAFRQANIELNPALLSLRFNVEQRGGRQFIKINSSQPLNEPFVDLLLELNWGGGRLVREYTFLLDPADMSSVAAAQASTEPAARSNASQAAPAATAPASRRSDTAAPRRARASAASAAPDAVAQRPASTRKAGDRLSLSTADDTAVSVANGLPKEKTMAEVLARVQELERLVADLERVLIARKSLEAELAAASAAKAPAPTAAVAAPITLPTATPLPTPVPAPATAAVATVAPVAAAPAATLVKTATGKASVPAERGIVDMLMDNIVYILAGLAALAAIIFIVVSRRRQDDTASEEMSILRVPTQPADPTLAVPDAIVDAQNSSFNSSFSPSASQLDINEVDPVAEAGVYIAYGRDAQAEDILREALRRHPKHLPARLKLMEIYAARKDAASFETQAHELHELTEGGGEAWAQAVALGLAIDPANALYGGSAEAVPVVDAEGAEQARLQQEFKEALRAAARNGRSDDAPEPVALAKSEAAPPAPAIDNTLEFDLNALGYDVPEAEETPAVRMASPDRLDMEFTMPDERDGLEEEFGTVDLSKQFGQAAIADPAPADPVFDMSGMDLDPPWAGKSEAPALATSSEPIDPEVLHGQMDTKLDLAVAYQEIGNEDGARELLDEVIKDGNADQVARANELRAALV